MWSEAAAEHDVSPAAYTTSTLGSQVAMALLPERAQEVGRAATMVARGEVLQAIRSREGVAMIGEVHDEHLVEHSTHQGAAGTSVRLSMCTYSGQYVIQITN